MWIRPSLEVNCDLLTQLSPLFCPAFLSLSLPFRFSLKSTPLVSCVHQNLCVYIYIYINIYLCVYVCVCVCIHKQCNTFERAHSHMLERFVWVLRTEVNSKDSVNYQESNFQSLEVITCYTLNVRSSPGGSGPWSGVVKFLLRYGLLFIRGQVMDAKANRIQVA